MIFKTGELEGLPVALTRWLVGDDEWHLEITLAEGCGLVEGLLVDADDDGVTIEPWHYEPSDYHSLLDEVGSITVGWDDVAEVLVP